MPNHVTNIVKASPKVLASLAGENGAADFATVIPQPEGIETGGCSGQHAPGVTCWYEWNTSNWGTKWNAYDIDEVTELSTSVQFDTAWSHPFPVIAALSKKFPEEVITVTFADEDLGGNYGHYTVLNGEAQQDPKDAIEHLGHYTDEARDFATQVKYGKSYAELRAEWDDEDEEDDEEA
jgi:hypothetical protein